MVVGSGRTEPAGDGGFQIEGWGRGFLENENGGEGKPVSDKNSNDLLTVIVRR